MIWHSNCEGIGHTRELCILGEREELACVYKANVIDSLADVTNDAMGSNS